MILLSLHYQKVRTIPPTTAHAFPSGLLQQEQYSAHTSLSLTPPIHHAVLHWTAGMGSALWQQLSTDLPSTAASSVCKILSRTHLETSHCHIPASCTLALPQGPLSLPFWVTSLLSQQPTLKMEAAHKHPHPSPSSLLISAAFPG